LLRSDNQFSIYFIDMSVNSHRLQNA